MRRKDIRLSAAALILAVLALVAGTLIVLDASARQPEGRPLQSGGEIAPRVLGR